VLIMVAENPIKGPTRKLCTTGGFTDEELLSCSLFFIFYFKILKLFR